MTYICLAALPFYYSILLRDPDINNKYYNSKDQKFFLPKDFFTYFLNNKDDYMKYFSSKELEYQKFLFYILYFLHNQKL